jgi:hypothetical protein
VPFNWIFNFGRLVEIRLALGNMGPVHADPAYWPFGELPENVARHMMAMLLGVPMLSMELSSISAEHKQVIANYIAFYKQHRQTLNFGHWFVEIRNGFPTWAKCESQDETIIIITDEAFAEMAVSSCNNRTYLLNMTPGGIKCGCGQAFDAAGNACGSTAPVGGRLEIL